MANQNTKKINKKKKPLRTQTDVTARGKMSAWEVAIEFGLALPRGACFVDHSQRDNECYISPLLPSSALTKFHWLLSYNVFLFFY